MESESDKGNSFKTASNEHVLRKILADEENKKLNSSSSSSSKNSEESKKTTSNSSEISEENIARSASTPSQDPNCVICLEPIQNRSFASSCCHTFCFTCLRKWSEEKAECPLCKQQFKSILHNVKENQTYDEYVVVSTAERLLPHSNADQDTYPFPATSLISEESESPIDSHGLTYEGHSEILSSAQIMPRLPPQPTADEHADNFFCPVFGLVNTPLLRQSRERKISLLFRILNHIHRIRNSENRSNPEPSTSGFRSNVPLLDAIIPFLRPISNVEQTNDDEIQVLEVVNPRTEQTPEIVDLCSDDDDEEPMTVIDASSNQDDSSPACTPSRVTPPFAGISVHDASSVNDCVLECQPSTSRSISTTNEVSAEIEIQVEENQELKESHHYSSDSELDSDLPEHEVRKAKLASAIIRSFMTVNESAHGVLIPQLKRRFSASDQLNESSDNERKPDPKKLKLQNVAACSSIDHSGSKSSHQ